ncbi:MAG: hypothetical protein JNK00_03195 [Flavipsychrobacter sp.]|nr:hypothetical protein [Flavipsychrobacter sp.]
MNRKAIGIAIFIISTTACSSTKKSSDTGINTEVNEYKSNGTVRKIYTNDSNQKAIPIDNTRKNQVLYDK